MLFGKNITARFVVLVNAILITAFEALVLYVLQIPLLKIAGTSIAFFVVIYLIMYKSIDLLFYRKIKLIYKLIADTKSTYKEEAYREVLPETQSMQTLENNVDTWLQKEAKDRELRIKSEAYRKEFLMNLAHELKTPVFSAQGYINTLQNGAIDNLQVRDKFLDNAAMGIDRLAELVKDIDSISQLEFNEAQLLKTKFVMQDLIQEVFQEAALFAQEKEITMSIKDGCQQAIQVFADRGRIQQILVNLVVNAIKYGHTRGTVMVGVYILDDTNGLVEVTDDGIGIAEEFLPRIFERFYRADRARTRTIGGTGLGLSIAKHIVESHGHSISCRSTVNVGTTIGFGISLG